MLNWVEEQMDWLDAQLTGGVPPTAEQLWTTVITRFRQNYTDTAERTKSQQQLKELRMQKDGLDDYIAAFAALARKAGYGIDDVATLDMFQQSLPNLLYLNCVKFHHPRTWVEWTDAARIQHYEYVMLRNRMKGGGDRRPGPSREQWQNALGRAKDPNAMDIGRTCARATLTDDEKQKLQREGRCFRCQKQGHISRDCPQKPTRANQASTFTAPAPSTATIAVVLAPVPAKVLTADDKANALLAKIAVEDEETRTFLADKLFGKQDFLSA
jgi:hypothetical protein